MTRKGEAMNEDTRWVVSHFLDKFSGLKSSDWMYVWRERERVAEMVLIEVVDDDLECMALHAMAKAGIALCQEPGRLDLIEAFVATQRAHLEVVKAAYGLE
jgi:hypothetical protein